MPKKKISTQRGFTLTEMVIAMVLSTIVLLVVGIVLADSQRGWNKMYNRTYCDVVTDGYIARKMFDAVMRRASGERLLLDEGGNWVEVYYYADGDSPVVDRYARFYESEGSLNVEYGELDPRATLSVNTVCENVSGCVFKQAGRSAQMILTLDDGTQTATVVSSAVVHN